MKTCLYNFTRGLYETECGGKSVVRPSQKCERCGRKPYDKELDRVKSSRLSNPLSDGNTRQGS